MVSAAGVGVYTRVEPFTRREVISQRVVSTLRELDRNAKGTLIADLLRNEVLWPVPLPALALTRHSRRVALVRVVVAYTRDAKERSAALHEVTRESLTTASEHPLVGWKLCSVNGVDWVDGHRLIVIVGT